MSLYSIYKATDCDYGRYRTILPYVLRYLKLFLALLKCQSKFLLTYSQSKGSLKLLI